MKFLSILVSTYMTFVLHSALAAHMAIAGCTPHLVLAGLVLMTVRMGGRQGLLLAAAWGFLSDLLTDGRLGVHVACFVAACYALQRFDARWGLRSPWNAGLSSAGLVWCIVAVTLSLRTVLDEHSLAVVCTYASGSALYTGVLVAVVSLMARAILPQPARDAMTHAPAVSNKWRMLTES